MNILGINENGVEQTYNLDEFLGLMKTGLSKHII